MIGVHAAGTNILTPAAAVVAVALADITTGLVFDLQDAINGGMLTFDLLSLIFATGCLFENTMFIGSTTKEPGNPEGKLPESGTGIPGGSVQLWSHFIIEPLIIIWLDI